MEQLVNNLIKIVTFLERNKCILALMTCGWFIYVSFCSVFVRWGRMSHAFVVPAFSILFILQLN